MPKIVFIEPRPGMPNVISQFGLPGPGTLTLGTMMKRQDWQVKIVVEAKQNIEFELYKNFDLAAFSAVTKNTPGAYYIADRFREMQVPVIMVGPDVTYFAEEALRHADFVIRGEGEIPLQAFINAWEGDRDFSKVPALSRRIIGNRLITCQNHNQFSNKDFQIVQNPMSGSIDNLDVLPFPDFSLIDIDPMAPANKQLIPVQISRKYPSDDSIKSASGIFENRCRYRSVENIIEELWLYNHRKNLIFFCDDNFTVNRNKARLLLRAMIREKFKFKWAAQVQIDVAYDKVLVRLMKRAGCHAVFIGQDQLLPASLKPTPKHQSVNDIVEAINMLRNYGIHVQYVDFRPGKWSAFGLQHDRILSHGKIYLLLGIMKQFLPDSWLKGGIIRNGQRMNNKWLSKDRDLAGVVEQGNPPGEIRVGVNCNQSDCFDEKAQAGQ